MSGSLRSDVFVVRSWWIKMWFDRFNNKPLFHTIIVNSYHPKNTDVVVPGVNPVTFFDGFSH